MRTFTYTLLRPVTFILRAWFPLKIINRQRIPKTGPVMLYGNHRIWFDVIAFAHTTRRQIFFISKDSNFKNPLAAWILRAVGAFPVVRHTADMQAIRRAMKILRADGVLGIFPEGTRNRTQERLQKFEEGAAMFALLSGAAIVPIYLSEFKHFHRTKVFVGQPVDMTGFEGKRANKARMEELTAVMLDSLAACADECEGTASQ